MRLSPELTPPTTPTVGPTAPPTAAPTEGVTARPTEGVTARPTVAPTRVPAATKAKVGTVAATVVEGCGSGQSRASATTRTWRSRCSRSGPSCMSSAAR